MSKTEPELLDGAGIRTLVEAHARIAGGPKKLAAQWDVTPSYISQLVNGHKRPSVRVCKYMGVEEVRARAWRRVA